MWGPGGTPGSANQSGRRVVGRRFDPRTLYKNDRGVRPGPPGVKPGIPRPYHLWRVHETPQNFNGISYMDTTYPFSWNNFSRSCSIEPFLGSLDQAKNFQADRPLAQPISTRFGRDIAQKRDFWTAIAVASFQSKKEF